jgi:hypothetical protein
MHDKNQSRFLGLGYKAMLGFAPYISDQPNSRTAISGKMMGSDFTLRALMTQINVDRDSGHQQSRQATATSPDDATYTDAARIYCVEKEMRSVYRFRLRLTLVQSCCIAILKY